MKIEEQGKTIALTLCQEEESFFQMLNVDFQLEILTRKKRIIYNRKEGDAIACCYMCKPGDLWEIVGVLNFLRENCPDVKKMLRTLYDFLV
jgi:hypothetical protein